MKKMRMRIAAMGLVTVLSVGAFGTTVFAAGHGGNRGNCTRTQVCDGTGTQGTCTNNGVCDGTGKNNNGTNGVCDGTGKNNNGTNGVCDGSGRKNSSTGNLGRRGCRR